MSYQGVNIITEPSRDCPVCGLIMPAHFLVCRPCWREVPFALFVEHKTALHNCHHREHQTPERLERSRLADLAVIAHLKQHSTAVL